MKKILAVALLLVIGWTAWPYWAAWSLANAVKKGDAVAIEGKVDWEPLRAGLRDEAKSFMMAKIAADSKKDEKGMGAFAASLAAMMGPKIVDGLVDSMVTPQGIARLVSGQSPAAAAAASAAQPDPKPQGTGFRYDLVKWAFFSDPTTFRIDVAAADGSKKADGSPVVTTMLFRWSGSWKLSRIFLPLDQLGGSSSK